jgi:hypothetical protein
MNVCKGHGCQSPYGLLLYPQNGGTNPLEGGAFVVQIAVKMYKNQDDGVKLKMIKE